jgi:hypothetical protein
MPLSQVMFAEVYLFRTTYPGICAATPSRRCALFQASKTLRKPRRKRAFLLNSPQARLHSDQPVMQQQVQPDDGKKE